ncbi:hypothetical protein IW261DRAFT_357364 [Armillaria novae-zelandiae]|uniref:DUF6534 domain-containing protein n=1 Tax=Armillaria novae-zelandiae TaxID=153914 RepID=A0AA39UM07_9AGAR|nr:hypothetical protein IW261DRAFT_357364 [Armillaria novae-zelandiae]
MFPVPPGYPIEKLTGPVIIAILLHWGLFGTLSVQLYLYYLAFPNDIKFTKYLVYGIYVLELVQTVLVTHDSFMAFGYGFGDIGVFIDMQLDWLTVPIMSAVVAFVGQVFYAYRIFVLSKSHAVPIFVICLSLISSVAGIITGAYCFQAGNIIELDKLKIAIISGIWCGTAALCDIVIAICMTYYLMGSNTSFRRTQILVTKLIRLTIETGSVTAAAALISFILYFAFPHQTFFTTPVLILPKLYVNTVYMVLNSRMRIVGGQDTYTSSTDTDIMIMTTILRDTSSQLMEDVQRTERRASATVVSKVSDDECQTGRTNSDSHRISYV